MGQGHQHSWSSSVECKRRKLQRTELKAQQRCSAEYLVGRDSGSLPRGQGNNREGPETPAPCAHAGLEQPAPFSPIRLANLLLQGHGSNAVRGLTSALLQFCLTSLSSKIVKNQTAPKYLNPASGQNSRILETKAKISKSDLIKLKSSCLAKKTINKTKINLWNGRKYQQTMPPTRI